MKPRAFLKAFISGKKLETLMNINLNKMDFFLFLKTHRFLQELLLFPKKLEDLNKKGNLAL